MVQIYKPKRLFRLGEANRTLPFVSRIVQDIVDASKRLAELQAEEAPDDARETASRIRGEEELIEQITDFAGELENVGCVLKDSQLGLVDFPADLDGRVVFLCWKLGETEIRYWHEIDAGLAGRQPVDPYFGTD